MTKEKIQQIHVLEQNLNNFSSQRQQIQGQLMEVESALAELRTSKSAYKIVGNIMVQVDIASTRSELEEKQNMLKVRMDSIEKQEQKLREKVSSLQKDVMEELENEKQ